MNVLKFFQAGSKTEDVGTGIGIGAKLALLMATATAIGIGAAEIHMSKSSPSHQALGVHDMREKTAQERIKSLDSILGTSPQMREEAMDILRDMTGVEPVHLTDLPRHIGNRETIYAQWSPDDLEIVLRINGELDPSQPVQLFTEAHRFGNLERLEINNQVAPSILGANVVLFIRDGSLVHQELKAFLREHARSYEVQSPAP
jgi:hypothetical protein